MSDFFSFEYIDEQPTTSNDILVDRGNYRKNQSLTQASTEYLREAMKRLVPSTFVYGESGIGNRAYELYGMLYGLAFSGNRSAHLVAALCVMHATYERRSDLVILPTDIEHKYADMKIKQMSYSKILNIYDRMCTELGITKLSASMEKVIERIFRYGCRIDAENRVTEYTQTAMKLYQAMSVYFTPTPRNPSGRRTNYQKETRPATIAAVCAVLASRVHLCRDIRTEDIARELGIHQRIIYGALNRFLEFQSSETATVVSGDDTSPTELPEEGTSKKKRKLRSGNIVIGGIEIPPSLTRGNITKEERRRLYKEYLARPRDETFSIPAAFEFQPLPSRISHFSQFQVPPGYALVPLANTSQAVGSGHQGYAPEGQAAIAAEHTTVVPASHVPDGPKDSLGFLFEDFGDLLEK